MHGLFPYFYQLDFLRNHAESEVLERQLLESLANADWNKDDSALTHNAWRNDCKSGPCETHSLQKLKEINLIPEAEPN